ncbi:MAG: ABC transporter ATP-binding protein, partial [Halanaerobiaceae bacterium]
DEPAAGMNDSETDELSDLLLKIRDEYNLTIFLVEHDMGLVMDICDEIVAINFGKSIMQGTPKEIQASPEVQEAYLGGDDEL